ncbi:PREDICTED: receptor-type tyrosine-protein phosphatase eta [Nanorana parkeri]|uniref:receptor-type tyrosine-protein phosphatase eta n=1 Tax=Nanorana parkeri TaxID=125878 RepID=UPI000854469E|nr:PREDICTED: receptor-type tyrosine-protein phosphatase eta [Nanorana parkeri]
MDGVTKNYSISYWNSSVASSVRTYTEVSTSSTITGLTSGTNYTISVVTVGVRGYQSTPVSQFLFTIPGQVSIITVSNNKSPNSLVVNWTAPAGKVSKYIVSKTGDVNSIQETTSLSVTFPGLLPGRNYTITIQTVSGDCNNIATSVTEATYPSPPGDITFTDIKTNNISLSWGEPINMTGVIKSYTITYWNSSSSLNWTVTSNTTNAALASLTSGTNYTVSVVTIGVRGYQTTPVIRYVFTIPDPVSELIVTDVTATSISLKWKCPNGIFSTFSFDDGKTIRVIPMNCISDTQQYKIENLSPYTEYTISTRTLSCFRASEVKQVKQRTSKAAPPPAPTAESVIVILSYNQIDYTFALFDSTNGPVGTYAVIVTSENAAGKNPEKNILNKTYSDFKSKSSSAYVFLITNAGGLIDKISLQAADGIAVLICLMHVVAVAGFTDIAYKTDGTIDIDRSLWTIGSYSKPITTPQNPGVIAGAVVGTILALLVVAAVGFFLWWRRRKGGNSKNKDMAFSNVKRSLAMSTDRFLQHFDKQRADCNLGFLEEYEKLKTVGTTLSKTAADDPENREKNRYTNVLPYDISRVILSTNGNSSDDYINANYIPGYINSKEFIASQGPLPKTLNDFWRMMWEKDVRSIVMLTKCVEIGKLKCEEYWPSRSSRTFGNLSVSLSNEAVDRDWTIRNFVMLNIKSRQSKHVRHFHYTAWPDHGVPKTTEDLVEFRNLIRDYTATHNPPSSPIVVHCSAGVGRTGTLIALDRLIKQIEAEDKVDVYGVVYDLRMHRGLMVQTENQYVFLNQCAADIIKARTPQNSESIYQNSESIYQNSESIYQNSESIYQNSELMYQNASSIYPNISKTNL